MKLLELVVSVVIVGGLSAIALSSLGQVKGKADYAQAYKSIGAGLKLGECPRAVNGWEFNCFSSRLYRQIVAIEQKGALKMVGAQSDKKKLFCKGIGDLTPEDIDSGQCPNLASAQ